MTIDIAKWNAELSKYSRLLEEMEENFFCFNNEFSNVSFFWGDHTSEMFFDHIKSEKLKIQNMIQELVTLHDIYSYLIDRYQTLGKKIKVELSEKRQLFSSIQRYENHLKDVIQSYEVLNLNFCYEEGKYLQKEKRQMNQMLETIEKVKGQVEKIISYIEEVEKEIKVKSLQFHIKVLKEADISYLF